MNRYPDLPPVIADRHVKCRNCLRFNLSQVTSKNGRVMKDRVGKCNWVSNEPWPVSVNSPQRARLQGGYMAASDGVGCPTFVIDPINCEKGVMPKGKDHESI